MYQRVCSYPCTCCVREDGEMINGARPFGFVARLSVIEEMIEEFMKKKPIPTGIATFNLQLFNDPSFKKTFPNTFAFLMDEKYDNNEARVPGSFSIFAKGGCITVAVNDKDRGLVAFVNSGTWHEVWELIERGIRDDSFEWKRGVKDFKANQPTY